MNPKVKKQVNNPIPYNISSQQVLFLANLVAGFIIIDHVRHHTQISRELEDG